MTYLSGFETPVQDFARVFLSTSWPDERLAKQLCLGKIDLIELEESELARMMKKLDNIRAVDPEWLEEIAYPRQLTGTLVNSTGVLTVTGPLFNRTVTRADLLQVANTDSVLRVEVDGAPAILVVSAVDGTDPILTLTADSGTSMPADGTYTFKILPETGYDAKSARNPRFIDRKFRGVTTQIFDDYVFQIEKTREIIAMEGVTNEVEHQVTALLRKMVRDRQDARINSYPVISGGLPATMKKTQKPRLMGLTFWPPFLFTSNGSWTAQWKEDSNLYVNISGENLTPTHLDNLCGFMDDNGSNFGSGKWRIVTHPWVRDYMHDFGISQREMSQDSTVSGSFVDSVRLKRAHKAVEILSDKYMPRSSAILVNMENVGYGSLEGDEFTKGELARDSLGNRRIAMRAQDYGVVLREAPVSIGMITNIGDGH